MALLKATNALARNARPPEIRVPVLALAATLAAASDPVREALQQRAAALAEEAAALEAENADLRADLAAASADLTQERATHADAIAEAEARGRAAGLEAGAALKAEALERLDDGVRGAAEQLRGDLKGLEVLAVALAKAALAKVFGDDHDLAPRVARLIARQLAGLERDAVLRVEVAAADFPDAEALERLSEAAGLEGIEVKALEDLAPGDCRMRLRLGGLDVGIGQQWARLSGLLDDALAVEAAA